MGEGGILYERNSVKTQRNRIHQGRHYTIVGLGIRHRGRRSMIFGPRVEPNHYLLEYVAFEGDGADFVQTPYCIVDEDVLCVECGNCPPLDPEDDYPFTKEE